MNNNHQLELLISFYEEEKIRLEKLIDECLQESEYLLAHYHSEALYHLNGKLKNFHNIDDKFYFEKKLKQRRIDWLEKALRSENTDYAKERYEKEFIREKEELEKLKQILKQQPSSENLLFLEQTFVRLLSKKIANLKFILSKADNLFLRFTYDKRILRVTIPYVKQHIEKWILGEEEILVLNNLGFRLTENETKLIFEFTGNKETIIKRLNIVLLKILFEMFNYKEFAGQSYIQFTEKK